MSEMWQCVEHLRGEPYYCTRCEQGKNIEVKIRQLEYEIQTLKRKLAGLQENRDEGVQ